jgi:hypothetical protein
MVDRPRKEAKSQFLINLKEDFRFSAILAGKVRSEGNLFATGKPQFPEELYTVKALLRCA